MRALVDNEQSGHIAMATSDPFLTRIADPGPDPGCLPRARLGEELGEMHG